MDHSPALRLSKDRENFVNANAFAGSERLRLPTFLEKRETEGHQMPRRQKVFAIFTLEQDDGEVLNQSVERCLVNSL